MAKRTQKAIADNSYQILQQLDLTGGLDLRRSPSLLAETRSRNCVNFTLREPGALRVRPGYVAFSTTNLGSSGGQGGSRIYLASTEFTLFAWGGGVYVPTDTGGLSTTPVLSGLSATEPIHFVHDRNLCAVMDSTSVPQKSTNGQTWTRLGIQAPSVASTLAAGSSGGLSTSEFEVSYTYKDRGLAYESNGAPVSTVSLTDTGSLTVHIPNSTDPQVDAIVLYARNKTSGEAVLRKVSSGVMSTGASSTFVVASSAWSANDEMPTTHTEAPILGFAVNWKNRWWGRDATVGNRLWFTDLFQPQAWYALYYIDLPFETGDAITALVPLGDTLIVFGTSNKPYVIIGETSLDFIVRPSAGGMAGALGPRACEVVEQGVLHCAPEGIYLFDGASDRLLSYDIEPAWRDLIEQTPSTGLAQIDCCFDFLQKEIRIAVPRRYPSGVAGEWILDLNRTREGNDPAWTSTDRPIGGYLVFNGDESTPGQIGKVLSWSSSEGRLWVESTGTTANGSNITAEFEGPTFSVGQHRARFIDLRVEYEPHTGAFTAETLADHGSQGQISLSIGAGLAQYGTAVYGTATYGGSGRRTAYTMLPITAEGRTVTQKFSYTGQDAFKVFGYALGLVPETHPRSWSE